MSASISGNASVNSQLLAQLAQSVATASVQVVKAATAALKAVEISARANSSFDASARTSANGGASSDGRVNSPPQHISNSGSSQPSAPPHTARAESSNRWSAAIEMAIGNGQHNNSLQNNPSYGQSTSSNYGQSSSPSYAQSTSPQSGARPAGGTGQSTSGGTAGTGGAGAPSGTSQGIWGRNTDAGTASGTGLSNRQKEALKGLDEPERSQMAAQMELQNYSRMVSFLSNIMKMMDDTNKAIISNTR